MRPFVCVDRARSVFYACLASRPTHVSCLLYVCVHKTKETSREHRLVYITQMDDTRWCGRILIGTRSYIYIFGWLRLGEVEVMRMCGSSVARERKCHHVGEVLLSNSGCHKCTHLTHRTASAEEKMIFLFFVLNKNLYTLADVIFILDVVCV